MGEGFSHTKKFGVHYCFKFSHGKYSYIAFSVYIIELCFILSVTLLNKSCGAATPRPDMPCLPPEVVRVTAVFHSVALCFFPAKRQNKSQLRWCRARATRGCDCFVIGSNFSDLFPPKCDRQLQSVGGRGKYCCVFNLRLSFYRVTYVCERRECPTSVKAWSYSKGQIFHD